MKILSINKFHYVRGGAERYYMDLNRLLESQGHEVVCFSMHHPRNEPSRDEGFFAPHRDFQNAAWHRKLALIPEAVHSSEAAEALRKLLRSFRPDIAHAHNLYFQLTPSVVEVLAEEGIPVVQTIHDLHHVCPSYGGYHYVRQRVCNACTPGNYWPAVQTRCLHGSLAMSAIAAMAAYVSHRRGSYRTVSRFITPSEHYRGRLIEGGFAPERVVTLPYCVETERIAVGEEPGGYFLFMGRLSPEKGVQTLIEAARTVDFPLLIAGEGPDRPQLENMASGLEHVRFLGYRQGAELDALRQGARAVLIPSRWHENSPLTLYEAFAAGRPVIATRMGGIPELVDDGQNGLLVEADDPAGLAHAMNRLAEDPSLALAMGRHARRTAVEQWSPGRHYERIMRLYSEVLA